MFPLGSYVRTAAKVAAMNTVSTPASTFEALADLEARVDRLLLVIEALWTMIKDDGHTDEELAARMAEIDKSDGAADGRRVAPTVTCRSCASKVMGGLPRCQICGTETGVRPGPLDGI